MFVSSNNIFTIRTCLYTDGISKFKSSRKSIWPIYLVSTDISLKDRFRLENIILLGIYYGESKPQIQEFLKIVFEDIYHDKNLSFSKDGLKFNVEIIFFSC